MSKRHCASLPGLGLWAEFDIGTGKHYVSHRAKSVAGRKKILKESMVMNKL